MPIDVTNATSVLPTLVNACAPTRLRIRRQSAVVGALACAPEQEVARSNRAGPIMKPKPRRHLLTSGVCRFKLRSKWCGILVRVLGLRAHSARFRPLRQQSLSEVYPLLHLDDLLSKRPHLLLQRVEVGSGVRVRAGDAALGHNLRDLDCAPRPNCSHEYDDDGGEKNLWVRDASLRPGAACVEANLRVGPGGQSVPVLHFLNVIPPWATTVSRRSINANLSGT